MKTARRRVYLKNWNDIASGGIKLENYVGQKSVTGTDVQTI
jgi:hypothetical protein